MGLRFRKSIKIAPGVKLNLGGKSASVSIGKRGASVNVSKNGVRGTVGIPGTGISYSEKIIGRSPQRQQISSTDDNSVLKIAVWAIIFFSIVGMLVTPSKKVEQPKPIEQPTQIEERKAIENVKDIESSQPSKVTPEQREKLSHYLELKDGAAIAKCLNGK